MPDREERCMICSTDMSETNICNSYKPNDCYKLNCNHVFHHYCIATWLLNNPNCPFCKSKVDADHRYVDEGIMTEKRLQEIAIEEELRSHTELYAKILFPNGVDKGQPRRVFRARAP